ILICQSHLTNNKITQLNILNIKMKTTYDLDHSFNCYQNGEFSKINILKDFPNKCIVLFFYPYDFTTVCPTEINTMSDKKEQFEELNTEVLLVSNDSIYVHGAWNQIEREQKGIKGCTLRMIGDAEKILGKYFDLNESTPVIKNTIHAEHKNSLSMQNEKNEQNIETVGFYDGNTRRATVILDKNFSVIHFSIYKNEIGRNTDEILRIIKMNQLYEKTGKMCECDKGVKQ
ncbi:Alkyl hydroperoxide reductasem, partial [Pseudoloma neurophilia]